MRKQKLKNLLKHGILLFGILFFTFSCQKDDNLSTNDEIENTSNYRIKYLSGNDFNSNSKLLEKLTKVKKVETKYNNRDIIHNSEHGFTIDTGIAKYVETVDGTSHSYTFLITRDVPTQITENLVITLQDDGTYQTSIVSYFFPDFDNIGIKNENIDFDSDTVLNQLQSRDCISWYSCTQWNFYCNDCENNPNEGTWECGVYAYNEVCDQNASIDAGDSSTGGGGSGSSSGSTGGSGTGGVGTNNGSQWDGTVWTSGGGGGTGTGNTSGNDTNTGTTTTTTTTSPFTQSQLDKLTIQTKNLQIKSRIIQMEGDLNSVNKEQGSEFRRIPNNGTINVGDVYTEHQVPDADTGFDYVKFQDAVSNSEVRVHMHHNNTNTEGEKLAPVFSIDDVFGMSEFHKQKRDASTNSQRNDNLSSILVSRRGLYALRVPNSQKALEFNDYLTNGATNNKGKTYEEVLLKGFKEQVIKKTVRECGNCSDAIEDLLFEINFIKFFKKLDCGLGLFVSYETDANGSYTWTFLTN